MGMGAALFVASGGNVTLSNVALSTNKAVGGNGGAGGDFGGGGGGGTGGNGGGGPAGGGGGGIGLGANGGSASSNGSAGILIEASTGGSGGGGAAGGTSGGGGGGGGGVGASNGAINVGSGGQGGAGGFGGGGGGGNNSGGVGNGGGSGFFGGGGGGGAGFAGPGGFGGFGGGGGGGGAFQCGICVSLGGTSLFGGGSGGAGNNLGNNGGGGGGAGFGGAIFVQQGGTLVVSGPLAVNGNSVSGGAGGASGGGNAVSGGNGSAFGNGIFLQGNGTLSFKPGSGNTQTISDVIADQTGSGGTSFNSGSWAMTVSGGGTLVLNGSNTYSGGTTVTGATLVVNGLIDDPTINSAGVLMGTGTVGPTQVNSGGTFAPGNGTPGSSMTVAGNLAFASGALYVVNLNPTMSSFASVMGTATLAGTVQANFSPGSYVAKQYTILTATGGIYGTFSGISNVNLPANASDSLTYGANAVFLNLLPGFASLTGLNQNQQDVAKALINSFNMTGGLPAQFFGLSPMGLTQSTGEVATGAERAAMQLTNEFLELMLDPFVNGRGNAGGLGGGAIGFAPDEQADLPPEIALAYASIVTKAPPKPIFDQRWTAWGSAFGGSNQANGVPAVGSNNVTVSTAGFAGGMDYHVSPSTVVGFALAGAGTSWGLANALGSGRSDAFQVGGCGISWLGPAYVARCARLLQSLVHHQPFSARRWVDRELHRSKLWRARGGRLPFRGAACIWRDPLRCRSVPGLPHAGLQRVRHKRRRLRTDLCIDECDRCAVRTRRALRRSDADLWQAAGPLRTRCLGARFRRQSGAERRLPIAARRDVHRQRHADRARLGTHHGGRATVPDAAMGIARQIRGGNSRPARRLTPAPARYVTRGEQSNLTERCRLLALCDFRCNAMQ
jgi:hypothetical protein